MWETRAVLVAALLAGAALSGCIGGNAGDERPMAGDTIAPQSPTPTDSSNSTNHGVDGDDNRTTPPPSTGDGDNGTEPASPTPPTNGNSRSGGAPASRAHVVIALIDSGINPYHAEFRDTSAEAHLPPWEYIPEYPRDAEALRLTLDAENLADALRADEETWNSVQAGKLYWVPGTRIIGLTVMTQDGKTPGFDDNGHGTMTASRAAGATTSLAPRAKIVAIEGLGARGVEWAGQQPWIDVQSNSWVNLVPGGLSGERRAFEDAARTQPVLAAAGNGLRQVYGVAGEPAYVGGTTSGAGIIVVGGHDNGHTTTWSGTIPHVAADACWNWAADASTIDHTGPRVGGGTSSSTPYVAGAAAQIILQARELLGDTNVSHEGGILARGPSGQFNGVLEDGALTLDEIKILLFHTADPTPGATHHDGDECDVTTTPYNTLPVGPGDADVAQQGFPSYYFVGYGGVNPETLAHALRVLQGSDPMPERPFEDQVFGYDALVRSLMP